MKLNQVFQTAEVPIPDRSGFDLSREHLLTTKVGTLTPVECIEVMPNDTISMGAMAKTTFPPFAVPFMGRIDACMEAFFVPARILWKGWQAFITQNAGFSNYPAASIPPGSVPIQVPVIDLSDSNNAPYLDAGSLTDYLGYKVDSGTASTWSISAMKHLAYHMVVDYWYRDQNNMKPFFAKNITSAIAGNGSLQHVINSANATTNTPVLPLYPVASGGGAIYDNLWDSTLGLGMLRQRCWSKDYFTTMTTRPQAGDAAQITFSTAGSTGNFTIADLRAANALQKWLERNGIASTDYGSQILAHYGVTPPDAVLDKPLLLGASRDSVYVGSVENNSNADTARGTNNPFSTNLGSAAGFGSGLNKGSLVNNFHAKEHGFIMVMYSIVPHAYYESGCERELRHVAVGDFAWPEYAHIGDQSVFAEELWTGAASSTTIGYNQRYSEYKHRQDKISGLLRNGQNLQVYALKRGFTSTPALGKSFLEIPQNYLDQVSQVGLEVSDFGAMVDIFFDTKAIRLLPQYSLPSL